jgi:hypothetical protein
LGLKIEKPTQKGRLVVGYDADMMDLLSVPGGRGMMISQLLV